MVLTAEFDSKLPSNGLESTEETSPTRGIWSVLASCVMAASTQTAQTSLSFTRQRHKKDLGSAPVPFPRPR